MINIGTLQVILKAKDQLSGKLKSVAGVALAAGVAIAKFTKDTIDLGTRLVDLSSQTGVSIQALQEFEFAGKQAGVGMKVISDSILRLGRRAAAELPETVKFLEKIGLTVADITSKKPGEAFALVAEKLQEMGPGAQQAAAAMGILGDAGLSILPAINQGLAGNIERFRELGVAMSDDAAKAAKQLGDTITDLEARWVGMKTSIGSVVIPALQNIVVFFSDLLPGAIQKVMAVSASFVAAIITDFRDLALVLALFSDSFVGVADKLGNMAHKMRELSATADAAASANFASFGQSIVESMDTAVVAAEAGGVAFSTMGLAIDKLNLSSSTLGAGMAVAQSGMFKSARAAGEWAQATARAELAVAAMRAETEFTAIRIGEITPEMAASFQMFGLQTQADMNATNAVAKRAFEEIRQTGLFTVRELDAAWKKYEANRQTTTQATTAITLESGASLVAEAAGQLAQLGGKFKAFGLAQAIIATAISVTKALANPPGFPFSIPQAAAAAIAGGVQIATIARTGFQQGTPGLDFQDFGQQSLIPVHGKEAIIPQGGGHQLGRELAAGLGQGGGGGDITVINNIELGVTVQTLATDTGQLSVELAPVVNDMIHDGRLTTEIARRMEGIFQKSQ